MRKFYWFSHFFFF